jgi:hypothetical protein
MHPISVYQSCCHNYVYHHCTYKYEPYRPTCINPNNVVACRRVRWRVSYTSILYIHLSTCLHACVRRPIHAVRAVDRPVIYHKQLVLVLGLGATGHRYKYQLCPPSSSSTNAAISPASTST